MSQYFGTDGIRGKAGEYITYEFVKELAYSVVKYINKHSLNKKILIGYDTRESSEFIVYTMSSLFLYYGINVVNCGICSTPCIAFLSDKYSLSFMITASHNKYSDNGIKIFNSNKEKISIDVIKEIEFNGIAFLDDEVQEAAALGLPAGYFALWVDVADLVTSPIVFTLGKDGQVDQTITIELE